MLEQHAVYSLRPRVRVKVPSVLLVSPQKEENMEVNKNGFLLCPKCRKKTNTKVLPQTELKDFPLYCNRCREEFKINHNCARA
jgi:uncharacterized protein YbaR (Trm112 family)